MILICFDGSDDARTAIERAGALFAGQPATILTIWEPFVEVMTRNSFGFASPGNLDFEEIDSTVEQRAKERADEGAELARAAGFDATPRTRRQETSIAAAVIEEAEAVQAGAIVMGTRGLTGVKSVLLGSVSHGVIQHADRPVLVVPSSEVAAARTRHRHREHDEDK